MSDRVPNFPSYKLDRAEARPAVRGSGTQRHVMKHRPLEARAAERETETGVRAFQSAASGFSTVQFQFQFQEAPQQRDFSSKASNIFVQALPHGVACRHAPLPPPLALIRPSASCGRRHRCLHRRCAQPPEPNTDDGSDVWRGATVQLAGGRRRGLTCPRARQ